MALRFAVEQNGLRRARSLLVFSLSFAVKGLTGILFVLFMISLGLRSLIVLA